MSDAALTTAGEIIEASARGVRPQVDVIRRPTPSATSCMIPGPGARPSSIPCWIMTRLPGGPRQRPPMPSSPMSARRDLRLTGCWKPTPTPIIFRQRRICSRPSAENSSSAGKFAPFKRPSEDRVLNLPASFAQDGSQFDRLMDDGERFAVGSLSAVALHVPGHTPADLAYVIGDAVFPGDTLFMPDYGTARADFPGGDARALYRSIRWLPRLPGTARLFMCHDYKAPDRDVYEWKSTVADERAHNIHVHDGIEEEAFVAMRTARDATLACLC